MENYTIENDINVLCVEAPSFPAGVKDAYDQLMAKIASNPNRRIFGLSWGSPDGSIIYKAAAEELFPGEADKSGCESFTIRKGEYISEFIEDFHKDLQSIGTTFKKLLSQPGIDPQGYCLEIYPNNKDVRCLVPLA